MKFLHCSSSSDAGIALLPRIFKTVIPDFIRIHRTERTTCDGVAFVEAGCRARASMRLSTVRRNAQRFQDSENSISVRFVVM